MSASMQSSSSPADETDKTRDEWLEAVGVNFPYHDPDRDNHGLYYRILRDGNDLPQWSWNGSFMVRVVRFVEVVTGETDEDGIRETEKRTRGSTARVSKDNLARRLADGKYKPGHGRFTNLLAEEYGPVKPRFTDSDMGRGRDE